MMRIVTITRRAAMMSLLFIVAPRSAHAVECNSSGATCLAGQNDSSGNGAVGVYACAGASCPYPSTGYYGLYGTAATTAIYGNSTGSGGTGILGTGYGFGVYGSSSSGYGLYGVITGTTGGVGVRGSANGGSAIGVYADSGSNAAVYAVSSSGVGGQFQSSTSNAVSATNSKTDWSAAVVTALAGSDSGLAYWGTGGIRVTGDAQKPGGGSWSAPSDVRIKKNIQDFTAGVAALKQVHPVTYQYNGLAQTSDDGRHYTGVIAQELKQVLPSMVSIRMMKLRPGDVQDTDVHQVDPSDFTYILINAVKEQQAIIDKQEARIAALEAGKPLGASVGGSTGLGIGFAGLVFGGTFLASRRKKQE